MSGVLALALAATGAVNAATLQVTLLPTTSTPPTSPAKPKTERKAPMIRLGNSWVSGHLPPEVVRRIVRQNYGHFRRCYERGLQRKPALAGQVTTLFVIDLQGDVSKASNDGSDLPDAAVVQCIVNSFKIMRFPRSPEPVTVRYTMVLEPG